MRSLGHEWERVGVDPEPVELLSPRARTWRTQEP